MSKLIRDEIFKTVHKYKNEYDEGVKDSKSGDEHCDFVTRFAEELLEITTEHGELEMIRGYNKAKAN